MLLSLTALAYALITGIASAAPTPQFFTYYALGSNFAEARDHVNLYWAVSWIHDPEELKSQLREARAAHVKSMLDAEFLLFDGPCPSVLRSDAASRWHAFASELAADGTLDVVVAVYPLDEPDFCGVPDADVQKAIAIIRADPLTQGKKVAALFSADVAKRWGGHYQLTGREHGYGGSLRAFDWVGFDCYSCRTIFTETAWDTVRFDASKPGLVTVPGPTLYDNFKSQLDLGRQQIIIVPKASIGGPLFGDWYDDPGDVYAKALDDRDVVLLAPFTWFDQTDGSQGVRSIPALRAAYSAIGSAIDFKHPEASPAAPVQVPAVEFYNASRDHYFMTSDANEIALLDSGTLTGWTRTGERFSVFAHPADVQARGALVCRFYGRPEAGLDSHFFSASADECSAVASKFSAAWLLESTDVFGVQLPHLVTGACPLFTAPVYRLYNGRSDANHRYTSSLAIRQQMMQAGWVPEGYGNLGVAMCAPG